LVERPAKLNYAVNLRDPATKITAYTYAMGLNLATDI
jgi:hypothetical protein